MNTSKIDYLKRINTIVLCAGHGGGDSGATDFDSIEKDDTIYMTDKIAKNLRDKGIKIDVVPHKEGLVGGVNYVNSKYKTWESAWAIEIHRDSFPGVDFTESSFRLGNYYWGGDDGSLKIGNYVMNSFKSQTGNKNCWARVGNHLYWMNSTKALTHLFELGFIQGISNKAHLDKMADMASKTIYEAFTGKNYIPAKLPGPQPTKQIIRVEWNKDDLSRYFDKNGVQLGAFKNNLIEKIKNLEKIVNEIKQDDPKVKEIAEEIKSLSEELLK